MYHAIDCKMFVLSVDNRLKTLNLRVRTRKQNNLASMSPTLDQNQWIRSHLLNAFCKTCSNHLSSRLSPSLSIHVQTGTICEISAEQRREKLNIEDSSLWTSQ